MKKLIKTSLVLVVMFATMVSYANEFPFLTKEKTKKITNLTLADVKEGSFLSIKDSNGLVLYKEVIEKSGDYTRGFDLTALPDGNYIFELDKDVEIRVIPFKVALNIVTFNKSDETIIFKPVIYVKGNKVYVSKVSFNHEILELKIFSDTNELILSEKIGNERNSLGKIYNFSTSRKGNYTFITKTAGRRFVKNIRI